MAPTFSPFYRRFIFPILYPWVRSALRLLVPRLRVTGRHHIPARGAVIFAANHISDFDPPLLGLMIRRPVAFMAKRELWDIWWLAPIITLLGAFQVDQTTADRAALRRAEEVLGAGDPLGIFPEGFISKTGELRKIEPGTLLIALKTGVPIVPVGLAGAQHIVPYGQVLPRLTLQRVSLHFGAPLRFDDLKGLSGREARTQALERLDAAMRDAIAQARRD